MFRDLSDASGPVPRRASLGPPGGITLAAFCAGMAEVQWGPGRVEGQGGEGGSPAGRAPAGAVPGAGLQG